VTLGGAGWKKTYGVQAQFRASQFQQVLRFTASGECRMAAIVRHFGDVDDAALACGRCDVCDPAGAVLRQFRHASAEERRIAHAVLDQLRPVDYKATGTLQRDLDLVDRLSRTQWEALLSAMARAGLIVIEDAEYEKDGEVRRFRKVRITENGLEIRPQTPVELLMDDGIVGEFGGGRAESAAARKKTARKKPGTLAGLDAGAAPRKLTHAEEALAARIRTWRSAEAKRLGVPAYLVLNDRTLNALAQTCPRTPNELLAVDGIGPAKAERFGEAILKLLADPA
jgi:ATP-dependent DNA helicase RecQ